VPLGNGRIGTVAVRLRVGIAAGEKRLDGGASWAEDQGGPEAEERGSFLVSVKIDQL